MGDVIRFPGMQLDLGLPPQKLTPPARTNPMRSDARICWSCGGNGRTAAGEKYCSTCHNNGRANPWLTCLGHGCTTVAKRRVKGQQFFRCPKHLDA